MLLLSREICVWIIQEYTDDTAELRKQVDALGGMAALQDPETQLLALTDLEQFVSAVRHLYRAVHLVHACSKPRHLTDCSMHTHCWCGTQLI